MPDGREIIGYSAPRVHRGYSAVPVPTQPDDRVNRPSEDCRATLGDSRAGIGTCSSRARIVENLYLYLYGYGTDMARVRRGIRSGAASARWWGGGDGGQARVSRGSRGHRRTERPRDPRATLGRDMARIPCDSRTGKNGVRRLRPKRGCGTYTVRSSRGIPAMVAVYAFP